MTKGRGSIAFGKKIIKFDVKRSGKRRTVSLFVDPYEGIFLRAPYGPTVKTLSKLVRSKATWILGKQKLIEETKEFIPRKEFLSGETFPYLGRQLQLKIVKIKRKIDPEIKVIQGRFIVTLNGHYSDIGRKRIIRRILSNWYRKHIKTILLDRALVYSKKMNLPIPEISLANQSKRWGGCNSRGKIRFNWHIAMAPMLLIDYVVAHEICHLKYSNHSQGFWKLLGSIMPNYEVRRTRLRKEGSKYFF